MEDPPKENTNHEDNSILTKVGAGFGLLLVAVVVGGCLFMIWIVARFFMGWM